jgi:hypothetical protein
MCYYSCNKTRIHNNFVLINLFYRIVEFELVVEGSEVSL